MKIVTKFKKPAQQLVHAPETKFKLTGTMRYWPEAKIYLVMIRLQHAVLAHYSITLGKFMDVS